MGRPVVVVTHSVPEGWPHDDAPFSFVTDGIEAAIERAKALAGDKVVGSTAAPSPPSAWTPACSTIWVDLVPVLLGRRLGAAVYHAAAVGALSCSAPRFRK
jgi:hypothetical protein